MKLSWSWLTLASFTVGLAAFGYLVSLVRDDVHVHDAIVSLVVVGLSLLAGHVLPALVARAQGNGGGS